MCEGGPGVCALSWNPGRAWGAWTAVAEWVPWTKGLCVTWLTAYLSPLLHRPPGVSICFSIRRRLLVTHCLSPKTRSSASSLIAFCLYISRLDNRTSMRDCKPGSTVTKFLSCAWRLDPTCLSHSRRMGPCDIMGHHRVHYVDPCPKGTLGDSQVLLSWNK